MSTRNKAGNLEQARIIGCHVGVSSNDGTAATWHLQTKLTLYKFRCKISFKLSESHKKLHSLKKLGDSQLSLRRTPLGPALRLVSVLERCSSYRESNKGSKERQGPTLGVRFTEVSVKRESAYCLWLL